MKSAVIITALVFLLPFVVVSAASSFGENFDAKWDLSDGDHQDILPKSIAAKLEGSDRIIGGDEASPGMFPYQAGLRMNKSGSGSWCGGVLISENYVLTAAHCAINATYIDVYLGAQNIRNLTEEGRLNIRVLADNITVHKHYNPSQIANDIAILRLPQPVNSTDRIQPIALPTYSDAANSFVGEAAVISGWGRNSNTAETVTDELQYTGVNILPNSVCQYYFSIARPSNICTETILGRGTCNGDSGGPLASDTRKGRILLGLTSFGSSSGCVACFPSAFVRVSYYLDWIAAHSDIVIQK